MTILWTIVPQEEIWEDEAGPTGSAALMEVSYGGVPLLARRTPEGATVIERLLTTDPNAFLRPELTPGVVIPAFPVS